jgi:hypothetical protein
MFQISQSRSPPIPKKKSLKKIFTKLRKQNRYKTWTHHPPPKPVRIEGIFKTFKNIITKKILSLTLSLSLSLSLSHTHTHTHTQTRKKKRCE